MDKFHIFIVMQPRKQRLSDTPLLDLQRSHLTRNAVQYGAPMRSVNAESEAFNGYWKQGAPVFTTAHP
jgi:uncharacterized protein (DUF2236 family)